MWVKWQIRTKNKDSKSFCFCATEMRLKRWTCFELVLFFFDVLFVFLILFSFFAFSILNVLFSCMFFTYKVKWLVKEFVNSLRFSNDEWTVRRCDDDWYVCELVSMTNGCNEREQATQQCWRQNVHWTTEKTYNSKLEILLFVFAITPSRALSCVCIDVYVCGSAWNHYSVLVPFVNVVLSIQALIETTCASAFRTHVYTRHGYFSNGLLVCVCICDSPTIFHDRLSRASLYSCSDTQIDSKSLYILVSFPMEILHCVNICVLVGHIERRIAPSTGYAPV